MDLGGFRKQHKISLSTIWLGGMLEQHQNVTISQIWLGGMLENTKKNELEGMLETIYHIPSTTNHKIGRAHV